MSGVSTSIPKTYLLIWCDKVNATIVVIKQTYSFTVFCDVYLIDRMIVQFGQWLLQSHCRVLAACAWSSHFWISSLAPLAPRVNPGEADLCWKYLVLVSLAHCFFFEFRVPPMILRYVIATCNYHGSIVRPGCNSWWYNVCQLSSGM